MNRIFANADSVDLDNHDGYARWRDSKLAGYPDSAAQLIIEIADLDNPSGPEVAAMKKLIGKTNMALYACASADGEDVQGTKESIITLAANFGLVHLDANLCADDDAISCLSVAKGGQRLRYIPYTNRPISWHTDGYYNKPQHTIRGMILHCISPAAVGGANALMDPEIAYILLREENPELIRALMHPDAMLIPANNQAGGDIRAAQGGPVFSFDGVGELAALHMRYTARTRSISWRDDAATLAAVNFLSDCLDTHNRYIFHHRMAAGQGVLCNNVLHCRTAFEDDVDQQRQFLRARYFDRISI